MLKPNLTDPASFGGWLVEYFDRPVVYCLDGFTRIGSPAKAARMKLGSTMPYRARCHGLWLSNLRLVFLALDLGILSILPPGLRHQRYTLAFHGRSIPITQQQFDDATWQEIVKSALQ